VAVAVQVAMHSIALVQHLLVAMVQTLEMVDKDSLDIILLVHHRVAGLE
jgi:hypothetical protein